MKPEDDILTPDDVAAWLKVSRGWVLDHASGRRRPFLPSKKLGRKVLFSRREVQAVLDDLTRGNVA